MKIRYGIFLHGTLLKAVNTPVTAYEEAQFAYQETGVFHEVRVVVYSHEGHRLN